MSICLERPDNLRFASKLIPVSVILLLAGCANVQEVKMVDKEPVGCEDHGFLWAEIKNATREKEEKELNKLMHQANKKGANILVCCYNRYEENLNGSKGGFTLLSFEVRAYHCE